MNLAEKIWNPQTGRNLRRWVNEKHVQKCDRE